MGITVTWDDEEQTMLYLHFEPEWMWDTYYTAIRQVETLAGTVTHEVDLIVDVRDVGRVPGDYILHARRGLSLLPDNFGRAALIGTGAQPLLSVTVDLLQRAFPVWKDRLFFAESLPEARAELARRRGSSE